MSSNKTTKQGKLTLQSLLEEFNNNSDIHFNINQQYIITTEDKMTITLTKLISKLEKKGRWKVPLGILVTIAVAVITTNFKSFIFPAIVWQTIFVVAVLSGLVWLICAAVKSRKQIGIEDVIAEIKRGSPIETKSLTTTFMIEKEHYLLFTGGYIDVPHKSELEPNDLTVEAWIYPLGEGEENGTIIRKAAHNSPGYILRWRQAGEMKVQFRIDREGEPTIKADGPLFSSLIRKWSHLAGTFDSKSNTASLFVNGKRRSTVNGKTKTLYKSGDRLTIGGSPNAEHESFYGIIHSVRIYRTVRYKKDFEPLEKGVEPDSDNTLVLSLTLNEGQGEVVQDSITGKKFKTIGTSWINESELDNK